MLRCLVLDHDDTVVRSSATVNHPAMNWALKTMRPGVTISYEDFMRKSFEGDFSSMCREMFQYTDEEIAIEFEMWKDYVRTHIPPPYEGMKEILTQFRTQGGIICVSSHSGIENISRDYQLHFGFQPHQIYGWELLERRKPHPFTIEDILARYALAPEEVLVVDDMPTGMQMAENTGVPFACAGWVHTDPYIRSVMKQKCPVYLETVEDFGALVRQAINP